LNCYSESCCVIESDCHCIKTLFREKNVKKLCYFLKKTMCGSIDKDIKKLFSIIECTLCALYDIKNNKDCELIIENMECYKTITYYIFAYINCILNNAVIIMVCPNMCGCFKNAWKKFLCDLWVCFNKCPPSEADGCHSLYHSVLNTTCLNTGIDPLIASLFDTSKCGLVQIPSCFISTKCNFEVICPIILVMGYLFLFKKCINDKAIQDHLKEKYNIFPDQSKIYICLYKSMCKCLNVCGVVREHPTGVEEMSVELIKLDIILSIVLMNFNDATCNKLSNVEKTNIEEEFKANLEKYRG